MKLHLPSRLRIAVLAAFVSVFTVAPSYGDMSVPGSNGYYAKGKCVKKKLSDGSYTYTDSYEWTSLWYDPGQGKYTLAQADGTFRDIKYDKTIIFDCQYVYSRDMVHDCPGDISYTNTLHINEDGGGNNYTWQCSKFDDEGNVTTPGVWILADTDSAVARFTNYGDMVVKDSRQESILRTIAGATEKADGTIEYNYVNNLQGIGGGKVIDNVSDISFSLAVTNTKSFTYDGGYTTGNGAFLSGSVSVLFDNLQNLTFSNNSANIGSIVWASQSSVWSGDHTGGFYVRNISGTASFNNNSGQLFRNTHSRYENVHELIFANNTHRLFASYNAPLYTEFEDCDKIVFSGNGREDATAIITNTRDSIYAGYTTFKNCGEIIFSGNIMENMLFDGATPEITNVGSVKFINNTVCDGYLIHDIGGTHVDMNITGVTDTFAIDNNNLTHLSGYATICNTDSYVSGSESKHGKLFSISGNEAYGDFRYSLNGGLFSVSHFDKFAANDNYVNSSVYGMLGNLHLSDVDAITFSNNTLYVDDGASVGGLMRGTASITDFASIEVMENFSGGEKDANIWSSLLGEMTIVGNDEDSTKTRNSVVNIHDNMFSGKTQVVDERFSVSNVAEFAYTDNIFYCDSTASGSSGAMLTDVRIFNAGKVLVEGNISKSENGRAFGGALGGVLNSVIMEDVGVALQNSQEVVIQNNAAVGTEAAFGGAITAPQFVYISGNEKVSITGNFAKASTIADLLTEEGIGTFADTYEFNDYGKGAMGGAIYVSAGFSVEMGLAIYGNNSATIRGNYITDGKTYQLQGLAIGFGPFETRTDMMLAAPENKTLDLYDPIFASGELRIGITQTKVDDFPDYYSAEMLNKGKVVFSAAHARQDLNSIKTAANAGKVTDAEWNASRTSIVRENIFLNSGSVEVRDNAILVSSSFSMGENTSLIVSSGGELRTSSFNTGYSPLLDSLSSPNVKIIMDGGSCQLSNNGIYLGTTQKLRVLSPSTINASALLLNQGSSLELVVSADNIQDACLTINFSGAKSFLMPSGYRFASAGSLTLESAEALGRGQYKLLHFEELTDSKLIAGFYENSDWADGFIVNGVGSGNSLEWVSNDDCSVDLVWTIGKTVTPPVNPDPEPEVPTPDNPPVGGDSLTWANAKKAVWQNGAGGWDGGEVFTNGADVSFGDGTVTIVGAVAPGEVIIAPTKSLTFKADKKNPGRISGDASVTIDAAPKAKVTMNDGNTYTGGTTIYEGMVKAGGVNSFGYGAITLNGGTLDLAGKAISNDIALEGAAIIKGGAKYTGDFSMGDDAVLMKGSVVNVSAGKTVTLGGGVINGTLSGQGAVNVAGDVALGTTGKLTVGDVTVSDGAFRISSKGLAMNGKESRLVMNGGSIISEGKLSTNELEMTAGSIRVESSKALSLDIKGKGITNYVSGGSITVAGKMNVTGDLAMYSGASIRLYDPSGSNKAMGLTVKGMLMTFNGGDITLSGALSAKDMYLNGGSITFNGSKHQTIKVGGVLMMEDGVDLNFNSGLQNGKSYKILTFKYSNLEDLNSVDFYELLGLDKDACILNINKKDITMKVLDANALKGGANTASLAEGAPDATTALVNPALPDYSGVADALVQANWGLVESSRAFVNAIGNRSMAVQLGSGERAVWASAIAGSSRRSSSGMHGGADTNITGGAIGMETQLGENSLLGMALGNSWTRVSAHNYGTIKQDTTHLGLYGQTNWKKLSADWSAAYGRSESKFNGSDWSQRAIQLDGRLSYNHALSETVLLRGFGGVQYYASDSARVDGIDTGEVQNLRGEIGVGIVRSTYKSSVYAELALHQDLVRDNPEVTSPFGQRYHGTNPGRTGINFTIGGSYALSDQWSVNASYTVEVVENANAHSVNVGATYKF